MSDAWHPAREGAGKVWTFVSGERVVLAVELTPDAINTAVGAFGSYLLVYMNAVPDRLSFTCAPMRNVSVVAGWIADRFDFTASDAEALAKMIVPIFVEYRSR